MTSRPSRRTTVTESVMGSYLKDDTTVSTYLAHLELNALQSVADDYGKGLTLATSTRFVCGCARVGIIQQCQTR